MMSFEARSKLTVGDIEVDVIRKDIKNLHLGVYPPDGRVRVAAPRLLDDDTIRLAVVEKLRWIRRQQDRFRSLVRQGPRTYESGETHYFLGRPYRLRVEEREEPARVERIGDDWLRMVVRPGSTVEKRRSIMHEWYREELRQRLEPLMVQWTERLNVEPIEWRIQRMKTKWGSCSRAGRILFNLELAKKPVQCVEYLVVHELVHLLEPHHDDRFTDLMDRHLPNWKSLRSILNEEPLAYETWTY